MSNQVLYRKYRPQKFSEISGQEHVVRTLINAITSDSVAHAYLFCGPKGSGKTTMARLLAKAVNCEEKKSAEPCNKCSSCKEIIDGRAVDLMEIDAASHRGIENIRELRDGIRFSPARMKYRIFILDEAHQLTSGAANALLKILEEAPSHAIFILATTETHKMIPTIISRCQRFDFRKLTVPQMVERMKGIAKKEGVKADEEALKIIATASGGSMRDGESLLSQVLSFVTEGEKIGKEDVKSVLGLVEKQVIASFIDPILDGDAKKALSVMNDIFSRGTDVEEVHSSLIHYLREMMILNIISGKVENGPIYDILMTTLTEEEMEVMKKQVERIDEKKIREMIDVFLETGNKIRYSPIPQLPLEIAVVGVSESFLKN